MLLAEWDQIGREGLSIKGSALSMHFSSGVLGALVRMQQEHI